MGYYAKYLLMLLAMAAISTWVINSEIVTKTVQYTAGTYSVGAAGLATWRIIKPSLHEVRSNPGLYFRAKVAQVAPVSKWLWDNKEKFLKVANIIYSPITSLFGAPEEFPQEPPGEAPRMPPPPPHQQSPVIQTKGGLGTTVIAGLCISGAVAAAWYLFKHWSHKGAIEPQKPPRIGTSSSFGRLRASSVQEALSSESPGSLNEVQKIGNLVQKCMSKIYPRLLFQGSACTDTYKQAYAQNLALVANMDFITVPCKALLEDKESRSYPLLDAFFHQVHASTKDVVVFIEQAEPMLTMQQVTDEEKHFMNYFLYQLESLKYKCLVIFGTQHVPELQTPLTMMLKKITFTHDKDFKDTVPSAMLIPST